MSVATDFEQCSRDGALCGIELQGRHTRVANRAPAVGLTTRVCHRRLLSSDNLSISTRGDGGPEVVFNRHGVDY